MFSLRTGYSEGSKWCFPIGDFTQYHQLVCLYLRAPTKNPVSLQPVEVKRY